MTDRPMDGLRPSTGRRLRPASGVAVGAAIAAALVLALGLGTQGESAREGVPSTVTIERAPGQVPVSRGGQVRFSLVARTPLDAATLDASDLLATGGAIDAAAISCDVAGTRCTVPVTPAGTGEVSLAPSPHFSVAARSGDRAPLPSVAPGSAVSVDPIFEVAAVSTVTWTAGSGTYLAGATGQSYTLTWAQTASTAGAAVTATIVSGSGSWDFSNASLTSTNSGCVASITKSAGQVIVSYAATNRVSCLSASNQVVLGGVVNPQVSGSYAVSVTSSNDATVASSATRAISPTVTSVNPASMPLGGSETVTVSGTGFSEGTTGFWFGLGITTGTVSVTSPTSATVALAVDASAGLGGRSVTATVGGLMSGAVAAFSVTNGPTISSLSPSGGRAGIGVTVTGTNFTTTSKVKVDGTLATTTYIAPSLLSYVTPMHADGTAGVSVVTAGIESGSLPFQYDTTAPTVTLDRAAGQADPTAGSTIRFTLTASEPIDTTTVGIADFALTNASFAAGSPACSGSGCSITLTATGQGLVAIAASPGFSVADIAGNQATSLTVLRGSVLYDSVAPTITIAQAAGQADPTSGATVRFSLTASEPLDLTTVGQSDFALTNASWVDGGLACGSATSCTLTVFAAGDGTILVGASAGFSIADLNGLVQTSLTIGDNAVTYDTSAPSLTLERAAGQPDATTGATIRFALSSGEALQTATFDASDLAIGGATLGSITWNGAGTLATITVAATTDGTVTIAPSGSFSVLDLAGNAATGAGGTLRSVVYDGTKPLVSLTQAADQSDPTSGIAVRFTFSANEPIAQGSLTAGDVAITNGSGLTIVWRDATTATITVTAAGQGAVTIARAAAFAVNDLAGNVQTALTVGDGSVLVDSVAPSVATIAKASTQPDPTSGTTIRFALTFSEIVTGIETSDFLVGGTARTFTVTAVSASAVTSAETLIVTVTGSGTGMSDGTVTLSLPAGRVTDNAGNPNTASGTASVAYDTTGPSVVIARSSGAYTNARTGISFVATFNEAVTGVATTKFTLAAPAGFSIASVTAGANNSYTVAVSGVSGASNGTITLTMASGQVPDLAGNLNATSSGSDNTVVYDTVVPTVTLQRASTQQTPTRFAPIVFSLTSGETLLASSVTASDFAVTNGTIGAGAISCSGGSCLVNVTPSADGTVSIALATGAAAFSVSDLAGNSQLAAAGTDRSVVYDGSAPVLTLERAATQADPTAGTTVRFTLTSNETLDATTVTSDDFAVSNGTIGTLSGAGTSWTIPVTALSDGSVTIAPSGAFAIADAIGNVALGAGGTARSVVVDTIRPVLFLERAADQPDPTAGSAIRFTFASSETLVLASITASDFTVTNGTIPASPCATSNPCTITVTATTDGTVSLAPSGSFAVADPAGNVQSSIAGGSVRSVLFDAAAPTVVSIAKSAGQADPANTKPLQFTLRFSETVSGISTGSFALAGTASGFSVSAVSAASVTSGETLLVTVDGTTVTGGTVTLSLPVGRVRDAAGNGNTASATASLLYDATGPGIAWACSTTGPAAADYTTCTAAYRAATIWVRATVTDAASGLALSTTTGDAQSPAGADLSTGASTCRTIAAGATSCVFVWARTTDTTTGGVTYAVAAADRATNPSSSSQTIVRDASAPTIAWDCSPDASTWSACAPAYTASFYVRATVSDPVSGLAASVTSGDSQSPASPSDLVVAMSTCRTAVAGTAECQIVWRRTTDTVNGVTYTVAAADRAGNATSVSRLFSRDATAPTVAWTCSATSATTGFVGCPVGWTNAATLWIRASITDGTGSGLTTSLRSVAAQTSGSDLSTGASTCLTVANGQSGCDFVWVRTADTPQDGVTYWVLSLADQAGNTQSNGLSQLVLRDRTAPAGTLRIGEGGAYTPTRNVLLTILGATDGTGSGLVTLRVRNSSATSGDTTAFTSSYPWLLIDQDGPRSVTATLVDAAGNIADLVATVTLDRTGPAAPVVTCSATGCNTTAGGLGWGNAASLVATAISASDGSTGSGAASYQVQTSDDGIAFTDWTTGASATVTREGTTVVRLRAIDAVGNVGATAERWVKLDRTAPTAGSATLSASSSAIRISGTSLWYRPGGVEATAGSAGSATRSWTTFAGADGLTDGGGSAAVAFDTAAGFGRFAIATGAPGTTYRETARGSIDGTITWTSLGVPAQAVVTGVQVTAGSVRAATANTKYSHTLAVRLVTSGGSVIATPLAATTVSTTVASPTALAGSRVSIPVTAAPAATPVALELAYEAITVSGYSGSIGAEITSLTLAITYQQGATVSVALVPVDLPSGIDRVAFPSIAGMGDGATSAGGDRSGTYLYTYGFGTTTATASGTATATAVDRAGNTATAPFTLIPDSAAPAISWNDPVPAAGNAPSIGVAVDPAAGGYRPAFSAVDASGGSGVASLLATLEEAPVPCTSWSAIRTGIASGDWVPFPDLGVCYRFVATATDAVGNVATRTSEQLRYGLPDDTTAPTVTLTIAGGAAWTRTTAVALTIAATDEFGGSGVYQMRFRDDDSAFTDADPWRPSGPSASWTLPAGDGPKTVWVQVRDTVGNESLAASATIALDTTVPTGSVVVNGGETVTDGTAVSLALTASDGAGAGIDAMRLRNVLGGATTDWIPFADTTAWTLYDLDGVRSVLLDLRDSVGNVSTTEGTIILDRYGPTVGWTCATSVSPTPGDWAVCSPSWYNATTAPNGLWIRATVADAVGFDPSLASSAWPIDLIATSSTCDDWTSSQTSCTFVWRLATDTTVDGATYLVATPTDARGHASVTSAQVVRKDILPPTGRLVINGDADATSGLVATVANLMTDNGSGLAQMRLKQAATNWNAVGWSPYLGTTPFTLADTDGTRYVYGQFQDAAGNVTAASGTTSPIFDTIVLDRVLPTIAWSCASAANPTAGDWTSASGCWSTYWSGTVTPAGLWIRASLADAGAGLTAAVAGADARSATDLSTGASTCDDVTTGGAASCAYVWRLLGDTTSGGTVYAAVATDKAGNIAAASRTAFRDGTAPSGTLTIAEGARWTTSQTVALAIAASDGVGLGVTQMRVRNAAGTTGDWVPFANTVPAWLLTDAEGTRTVEVWFRDGAGNTSALPATATIGLDRVAPSAAWSCTTVAEPTDADWSACSSGWYTATVRVRVVVTDATSRMAAATSAAPAPATSACADDATSCTFTWTLDADTPGSELAITARDLAGQVATLTRTVKRDTTGPIGLSLVIGNGGAYTGSGEVTLALGANDGIGSGVAAMRLRNEDQTWADAAAGWESPAATRAWSLSAGDGQKRVHVQFRDLAGIVSDVTSATVLLDTMKPSGTLRVNGGAELTASTRVTLTLGAEDGAGAGVAEMRLADAGGSGTATGWIPFTASSAWTLPGDGLRSVTLELRDRAGNVADLTSGSILVDIGAPTVSLACSTVSATDGFGACATSWYTSDVWVRASLADSGAGLGTVASAPAALTSDCTSGAAACTVVWRLASDMSAATYAVSAADRAGNPASGTVTVKRDATGPTPGSISIAAGAEWTTGTSVALAVAASDAGSGVARLELSLDGVTWSASQAYATSLLTTLTSGDGTKSVAVRFTDAAGNVSAAIADAIGLDTTAPTGTIAIDAGAVATRLRAVALALTRSDAGSGVTAFRLRNDAGAWGAWTAWSASPAWDLADLDGSRTVSLELRDAAGNVSASPASASILLDRVAPTTTVTCAATMSGPWADCSAATSAWYTTDVYVRAVVADPLAGLAASVASLASGADASLSTCDDVTTGGTASCQVVWHLSADISSATYSIGAPADVAGNAGSAASRTIRRDATPPSVAWACALPNGNTTPAAGEYIADCGTWTNNGSVWIRATVSDGLSRLGSITSGDLAFASQTNACAAATDGTASCEITWKLAATDTTSGGTLYALTVRDRAGNGTRPVQSVKREKTAPSVAWSCATSPTGFYAACGTLTGWYGTPVYVRATLTDTASGFDPAAVGALATASDLSTGLSSCLTGSAGILSCTITWARVSDTGGVSYTLGAVADRAGNATTASSQSVKVDMTAPAVSLAIAGGAEATAATSVALSVATDDGFGSGGVRVRFRNDDDAFGDWVAVTSPIAWQLAASDGTRSVTAEFIDLAGNIRTATDTIVLDRIAPSGTLAIAGGDLTTESAVELLLGWADGAGSGVTGVQLTNDPAAWPADWSAPAALLPWTLAGGLGERTVHLRLRDAAGNVSASVAATTEVVAAGIRARWLCASGVAPTDAEFGACPTGWVTSGPVWVKATLRDIAGGGLRADSIALSVDDLVASTCAEGSTDCVILWRRSDDTGPAGTTYMVGAADALGYTLETQTERTLHLDTTAPSGILSIAGGVTAVSSGDVALAIAASDAASGLATMAFSADGVAWSAPVAFAPTARWSLTSGDGPKTVFARLVDRAGLTAIISTNVALDTTGPVVAITAPAAGATADPAPLLGYTLGDGLAGSVVVTVNGIAVAARDGEPLALAEGANTIVVSAADALGNRTTSAPRVVTLDTTGPALAIIAPAADSTTASARPIVSYSVGDATSWTLLLDGVPVAVASGGALPSLADGRHTLQLLGRDALGNGSSSAIRAFWVDTTGPVVAILAPVAGTTSAASVTLRYSLGDGLPGSAVVTVNGSPVATRDGEALVLAEGANTIVVSAADAVGNRTSSAPVVVTADRTGPAVAILAPSDGTRVARTAPTLTYGVGDATSWTLLLDGAPVSVASGSALPTLSDGSHVVVLRGLDPLGNAATATSTFVVDPSLRTATTTSLVAIAAGVRVSVAPTAATGSVTLAAGDRLLGSCPLSSGSCEIALAAAGTYRLVASYAGDQDHLPSVSGELVETVALSDGTTAPASAGQRLAASLPVLGATVSGIAATDGTLTVSVVTLAPDASATADSSPFLLGGAVLFVDFSAELRDASGAVVPGSYELCLPGGASDLIWHRVGGVWTDITSDHRDGLVCGTTTSFSPFAVAPAKPRPMPSLTPDSRSVTTGTVAWYSVSFAGSAGTVTGSAAWSVVDTSTGQVVDSWTCALAAGGCDFGTDRVPGSYLVRVRYSGDPVYAPVEATAGLTVTSRAGDDSSGSGVTLNPQTLEATAATSLVYGRTTTIAARASSGLAPRFVSLTLAICTIDPTTGVVRAVAAGSCRISIDQPGDESEWEAAEPLTRTITVTRASVALTMRAYLGTTLLKNPATVRLGKYVTLRLTTTTLMKGRSVELWQRFGATGQWKKLTTRTVDSLGRASYPSKVTRPDVSYRWRWVGSAQLTAATSGAWRIYGR